MNPLLMKIELVESLLDEEYINSDEFKEYCRLMDEALALERAEREANQAQRQAEEAS